MQFNPVPTEQTTAVTDFLMMLASIACLAALHGASDRTRTRLWMGVFGLLGLAGALGSVAHGVAWRPDIYRLIWQPLNLVLGLTIALFVAGAVYDTWGAQVLPRVLPALIIVALAFFGVTQLIQGTFLVFVVYEALAMLTALILYGRLALSRQLPGAWMLVLGIMLTIVAAVIQATKLVRFTLVWPFDHNGVFHLIQILALPILVAGLRIGLFPQKR
ncbi:MAG: hypothetical protein HGA19_17830 [Oscillochloris sp.]|nr:hypothetical protein [Oscillochloris sp.]